MILRVPWALFLLNLAAERYQTIVELGKPPWFLQRANLLCPLQEMGLS